jgi:precorrin-3B methylase
VIQCQLIYVHIRADAYVIIFSIAHRETFDTAVDLLSELRMDMGTDRTVIMVGNKLDLVRKRRVKTEGKDITEL